MPCVCKEVGCGMQDSRITVGLYGGPSPPVMSLATMGAAGPTSRKRFAKPGQSLRASKRSWLSSDVAASFCAHSARRRVCTRHVQLGMEGKPAAQVAAWAHLDVP